MEIKRRDFLRLSLATGAAVALGGPPLNAFANGKDTKEGRGGTVRGLPPPSPGTMDIRLVQIRS